VKLASGKVHMPVQDALTDEDKSERYILARPSEREHEAKLIPNVQVATIKNGGHFLPLDRPQELIEQMTRFAR
jgi:pimeloyl-ACP methyl ester carboxylesterase